LIDTYIAFHQRRNPGYAGLAVVAVIDDVPYAYGSRIGDATNFEALWHAIELSLRRANGRSLRITTTMLAFDRAEQRPEPGPGNVDTQLFFGAIWDDQRSAWVDTDFTIADSVAGCHRRLVATGCQVHWVRKSETGEWTWRAEKLATFLLADDG
jgi:hypothetical protein